MDQTDQIGGKTGLASDLQSLRFCCAEMVFPQPVSLNFQILK